MLLIQSTQRGSFSQERGGLGILGSQPGVQTLKSLVEVTLPEESSTNRWHCLHGHDQEKILANEKSYPYIQVQLYNTFISGSHRAVTEKGQVHPDRDQHDSGFSIQILQSGSQLQEGQLLISPVQTLQPEPEQGGTGISGQSIQIPHQFSQTWKSQVAETNQLESSTNRWHCLQGQDQGNNQSKEKLFQEILNR